jgi:cathepsin B
MKISILLALLVIGFTLADHHHNDENKPFITREKLEELRNAATFEVLDYESHPFKNWSLSDIKNRLGLLRSTDFARKQIFYGNNEDLPESFDSRKQWPDCIHPIRDQQRCGSCWAFAASEVLSDRFCIATDKSVNTVLSPQDLVSCDPNDYGCDGGYLDKSWDYIRDVGIVTDECLPYVSGDGNSRTCPFKKSSGKCKKGTFKKYRVTSHQQHETIADAKNSLMTEGPLEAAFEVYDDFMSYSGGVYRRTSYNLLGGHAVKVVGWGKDETDGTEYWIVANSWGNGWGENGHFRIAFGECDFESQLWSGKPDVHVTDVSDLLFLQ